MKMPLEWHKKCLENRIASNDQLHTEATWLRVRFEQEKEHIQLLAQQINRAEIEGRDSFDPDKYGVKRNKEKK